MKTTFSKKKKSTWVAKDVLSSRKISFWFSNQLIWAKDELLSVKKEIKKKKKQKQQRKYNNPFVHFFFPIFEGSKTGAIIFQENRTTIQKKYTIGIIISIGISMGHLPVPWSGCRCSPGTRRSTRCPAAARNWTPTLSSGRQGGPLSVSRGCCATPRRADWTGWRGGWARQPSPLSRSGGPLRTGPRWSGAGTRLIARKNIWERKRFFFRDSGGVKKIYILAKFGIRAFQKKKKNLVNALWNE